MHTKTTIATLAESPNKYEFSQVTHYGIKGTYYDGFLIRKNDDIPQHFPDDQPREALAAWLKLTGKSYLTDDLLAYFDEYMREHSGR